MTDTDNKYADGFPFSREGEDFKHGLSLMREVLGEEASGHIESLLDNPLFGDEIGYVFSKTWGALYEREGLTVKERSLILMGTDLALGREGPLKDHMKVALHAGMTPKQIIEVLFQTVFYLGAPAMVLGLKVANEVLGPEIKEMLDQKAQQNNNK